MNSLSKISIETCGQGDCSSLQAKVRSRYSSVTQGTSSFQQSAVNFQVAYTFNIRFFFFHYLNILHVEKGEAALCLDLYHL